MNINNNLETISFFKINCLVPFDASKEVCTFHVQSITLLPSILQLTSNFLVRGYYGFGGFGGGGGGWGARGFGK